MSSLVGSIDQGTSSSRFLVSAGSIKSDEMNLVLLQVFNESLTVVQSHHEVVKQTFPREG